MASKIRNLKITEISLVDRPANHGAAVLLHKRDEGTEMEVDIIEIEKRADGTLARRAEELRKANPKLTEEQLYARAYSDPANRDLVDIIREARVLKLRKYIPGRYPAAGGEPYGLARTQPEIEEDMDSVNNAKKLNALYREYEASFPGMTGEQIRARMYLTQPSPKDRANFEAGLKRAKAMGSSLPFA